VIEERVAKDRGVGAEERAARVEKDLQEGDVEVGWGRGRVSCCALAVGRPRARAG
jgi:hypothetical protein